MNERIFIKLLILSLLFYSCSTTNKTLNNNFDFEISHYELETTDTLVDIGCGYAFFERNISNKFQNLKFILEDLPTDIWGNDLEKNLIKHVKNSPYAPTFGNNTRYIIGRPDSIPLESGKYERILCRITLHEFTNRKKMVSELERILSPTGILLVIEREPLFEGQRDKSCKQLYLKKTEVIESFKNLILIDTIRILPLSDNGILFKFKKKNYR